MNGMIKFNHGVTIEKAKLIIQSRNIEGSLNKRKNGQLYWRRKLVIILLLVHVKTKIIKNVIIFITLIQDLIELEAE